MITKVLYTCTVLQVSSVFILLTSEVTEAVPPPGDFKHFPNRFGVSIPIIMKIPDGFIERDMPRPCKINCPRVYWPVCGVDGDIYVNICARKCLGMKGSKRLTANCLDKHSIMVVVPSSWKHPAKTTKPPMFGREDSRRVVLDMTNDTLKEYYDM